MIPPIMRSFFLFSLVVLAGGFSSQAATITGRVISRADGNPVSGIRVGAQSAGIARGGGEAVTNADGVYEIKEVRSGIYNVALDIKDGLEKDYTARAHENLELQKDDRREGVDFELIPGVVITGRVTAEDSGEPLSGVSMGVYGPAHPKTSVWVQATKTDADGNYRLRVPEGKQYIYLQGSPPLEGFDTPLPAYRKIVVKEGETVSADFKLPRMNTSEAEKTPEISGTQVRPKYLPIKILAPEPFQEVTEARPVLKWDPMKGAVHYAVTWSESTSPDRQDSEEEEIFVSQNELPFPQDLKPKTRYRWQVAAYDSNRRKVGVSKKAYFLTPGASALFQEERQMVEDPQSMGGNIFGVAVGLPIDPVGLPVVGVADESPAKEAGVMSRDVLFELNGMPIKGLSSFGYKKLVAGLPIGKALPLVVLRDGERVELKVTLRARKKTDMRFP